MVDTHPGLYPGSLRRPAASPAGRHRSRPASRGHDVLALRPRPEVPLIVDRAVPGYTGRQKGRGENQIIKQIYLTQNEKFIWDEKRSYALIIRKSNLNLSNFVIIFQWTFKRDKDLVFWYLLF